MKLALGLAFVLGITACSVMPLSRRPGSTPHPDQHFASKRVVDMKDPVYLIAADGSECTVTEEKYRNTKIGDNVLCMWRAH